MSLLRSNWTSSFKHTNWKIINGKGMWFLSNLDLSKAKSRPFQDFKIAELLKVLDTTQTPVWSLLDIADV